MRVCTIGCRWLAAAVIVAAQFATPAGAWDCRGHRAITYLALDRLPDDAPAWLRDASVRDAIASNSCEPDRWRATTSPQLQHVNNPDHYIDVEDLEPFGLTLHTLPPFRYECVRVMSEALAKNPEKFEPIDPLKDRYFTRRWPGFVPYSIAEAYGRLQVSFKTLRMLEAAKDPKRAPQIEGEKANIVAQMGILSHFVGDAAQPLHTTRHHHGWDQRVPNPNGYTTRYTFHAYIDGDILEHHGLNYDTLKADLPPGPKIDGRDPWPEIIKEIDRSFAQVEPLYAMDKSGELEKEPGKKLITERLEDAGSMLGALYAAAWEASKPTDEEMEKFVQYDGWKK